MARHRFTNQRTELHQVLRREAVAAQEEAIRSGGEVSAQRVEALERLARLVEICDAAAPVSSKRWAVSTVLAASLAIASLLLFLHVPETEVELDLALSEVRFSLPTRQVLLNSIGLAVLGAAGINQIQIPRSRERDALPWSGAAGGEFAVRLSLPQEKRPGSINLAPLALPGGSRVTIRYMGTPRHFRLSVAGAELDLRTDVDGIVRIERSDGRAEQLEFVAPGPVLVNASSKDVDLDLPFLDSSEVALSPQLAAQELSVVRVDEFQNPAHPIVHRASTVLSGTLYLESLDGQESKLRAGQMLQFAHSRGEIRSLRLRGDHIDMDFRGTVQGMMTGSVDAQRTLMPTLLEWLKARHGLSLLWGSALYLFGLVVGILRWWRKPL